MEQGTTLVSSSRRWAAERPEETAYVHLVDGERETETRTWAELDRAARAVAATLQDALGDAAPGARALLLLPHGLAFADAFLGCLYAGAVAVPTNPPSRKRRLERTDVLARDSGAAVVLTTAALLAERESLVLRAPALASARWIAVDAAASADASSAWRERESRPQDLAFLQYTSGSTGEPRGVVVRLAHLRDNHRVQRVCWSVDADSTLVSWLPFHHDMGLIGKLLLTVDAGCRCVLMSPSHFLERPLRWLEAVSRYRGTTTGAPDFAYRLCTRRANEEVVSSLDLGSVVCAYNGAEPVRSDTLERFARAFAPAGLRPDAMCPAYGLAEATLVVTGVARPRPPVVLEVDRRELEEGRALPSRSPAPATKALVSSGRLLDGFELATVDPETLERVAEGRVGELWLRGPSVADGYWEKPEKTRADFHARLADGSGPWLRTGDLGIALDGEVYVTGRLKDLIILRGENLYPDDVERACEGVHPALRDDGAAAFADEIDGEERLVVVHELRRPRGFDGDDVAAAIRAAVAEALEIEVAAVVLLPAGALPRTTSGKKRRRATRARWHGGELPVLFETRPATTSPASDRPAGRSRAEIADWIARQVSARLGVEPQRLERGAPLAALGVDSLTTVELFHAVESSFGPRLPLARLFDGATIDDLAAEVAERAAGETTPVSARAGPPPDPQRLAYGQRSLWFLHRLDPRSPAYLVATALRVLSPAGPAAVERALARIVQRHEVLRTTYHDGPGGEPRRSVHAALPPAFARVDARAWSASELDRRLAADARCPFDLGRGPLLRAGWYERAGEPDVLLLASHHIALDHWSMGLLLAELAQLVAAEGVTGGAPAWPPPAFDFGDHVHDEEARAASGAWENAWLHFERVLAGAPEELALPFDFPRPVEPRGHAWTAHARMGGAGARALRSLARRLRVTPNVVCLAVFEALVARLTGQEDFLVGTLSAGRGDARVKDLVGYLVNPVVLRADLTGAPSVEALIERVRTAAAGAFRHGELPFPLLVERLHPERAAGRNPLFQALFSWQHPLRIGGANLAPLAVGAGEARLELDGLTLETRALAGAGAQFDLCLTMAETGPDEFTVALECDADLFRRETAERWLADYLELLAAALADPGRGLSGVSLLGADELGTLRRLGTGPPRPAGAEEPLAAHLERVAMRRGAAPALVEGERSLDHAALGAWSARLAARLRERGAAPGVVVGLELPRSLEQCVGVLAVLRSGAAWLPLDPALSAARRGELERSGGAAFVVTRADVEEAREAASTVPPVVATRCADPAYVLHTSGSTGRPKAALVPQGALATHALGAVLHFGLTADDRVLHMAAIGFDLAVEETLPALLAGACVVVWPEPSPPGVDELLAFVARHGITVLDLPTVYWHEWMRIAAERPPELPPSLRLVVVGGEAASAAALATWRRLAPPGVRWVNTYGPTEATVTTTLYDPAAAGEEAPDPVPIGRPVAGYRVALLDPAGHPAPPGAPGELCIGGAGLALGYANDPRQTAERFVPDPFAGEPGARLYRTGDRARFRPDGALEFLGRLDDQVKIRGFRVEPGEVAAHLLAHPAVGEAHVLAGAGPDGRARLAAYVVGRGGRPDPEQLLSDLRRRVPEHLVPAVVLVLDALPRTERGKVDRRALPGPAEPAAGDGRRAAPAGDVERALAAVWRDVLGVERVGRHDDFFALGGDSIQSLQVAARAARAGLAVTPAQIFRLRTPAALAAEVLREAPAPVPDEPEGPVPLTAIQHWFFALDAPEPSHWNLSFLLEMRAAPSPEALARALRGLVERHDALRLRFSRADGAWRARVVPAAGAAVPLAVVDVDVDVAGAGEEARASVRRRAAERQADLDLERGPLFAATLFRQADGAAALCLIAHHLVVDAVSWRVLTEDLEALLGGRDPGPPPVAWRVWARHRAARSTEGAEPRPAAPAAGGATRDERALHGALAAEETAALERAAREARASVEELLVGALARALARYEASPSVALELERHGRDDPDLDVSRTVGWFTDLARVVVDAGDPDEPAARSLARVKEGLRSPRADALAPATSFNFLGRATAALAGPDRTFTAAEPVPAQRAGSAPRAHAFEVDAWIEGDALRARWLFDAALHDPAAVEAVLAAFLDGVRALAGAAVDGAALVPSDFPHAGLDRDQLDKILARVNPDRR